ncbi:unnamed protein product [Lupinus luteus]|uniref:Leucine-rich repeat-containing N-terminal plant-type domain-containing protein n=1 Tax=Lupinus luteus TaxID=3873 RepID=A0AAV1VWV3_LUPLU
MSSNQRVVHCNEKEQGKLLLFKQGINDPINRLSSWSSEHDCCEWKGVQCHNTTGRITSLDLNSIMYNESASFKGEINLSLLLQIEFLNYLDLSANNFTNVSIQPSHNNITISTKLHHLDLSYNQYLHIDNLHWLSQLPSLKHLDLTSVNLEKETNWLEIVAMLPKLLELLLSNCELNNIHSSLKYVNLTSLVVLDLSHNNFNSEFPQWLNLRKIKTPCATQEPTQRINSKLAGKSLILSGFRYPFQSRGIFQKALDNFSTYLLYLLEIISYFEFHMDANWIPSFQLEDIDLSNTVLGSKLPAWLYTQNSLHTLDISSTGISLIDEDKFPSFVAGIEYLYLLNNSISADISNVILSARVIRLDHNNFTGKLPSISTKAVLFDVSHNSFSRGFPNSWVNWTELFYIKMESNKLTGELPPDMSNLTELLFINLENNEFSGKIPRMPPNSEILILKSNQFEGNIPPQLCNLSDLYILDFSHNKLSGSIPQCLHKIANTVSGEIEWSWTIDLSANNLSGEILEKLFRLVEIRSLNLSHNHLTGKIPNMIGDMRNLESLDLSYNQLVGEIPQSMAGLTFLEVLNLSYNNFNGQVPQGPQLQSFEGWSYVGNPELCGVPLTKNCTQEENLHKTKQHVEDNSFRDSLYLGMGVGFAMGFWGLCGSLFLSRTWRHAYFQFLNHVVDKIHLTVALKFRNFGG